LRKEYHLPWLRSQWVAYQAAKAAFVFKEGRARNDYEKALPHLRVFYGAISAVSDEPFDIDRAASLELEWWIVHRERDKHSSEDLPKLLAETAAVIYAMPYKPLLEHGKLRAEAMKIRDDQARIGRSYGARLEQDWEPARQVVAFALASRERQQAGGRLPLRYLFPCLRWLIRRENPYGRYPSGNVNSFTLFSATSGEVPEFQRGGGILPSL
jgi:hypothetical protein